MSKRLAALSMAVWALGCHRADEPLNLVVISLDTVRADHLSLHGYPRPTTPSLDRLAEQSVWFTNCVAQSTATAASHMSLFTGQYVHRHGLLNNTQARFPRTTLASVLREQGFRTGAFTGHGSLQAKLGHGVGFDVFRSEPPEGLRRASRNLPDVVPEALAWLDAETDEPFFLLVHGYDPHCPYAPLDPPAGYAGELDEEMQRACGMRDWGPLLEHGAFGDNELSRLSALYDAELTAADAVVGAFVEALDERGLLDRSLLVFTSDHGELLGDHGWVGHTRLWEPEIRVPLLIRFPDGRYAGRLDDPAQHVDVMPTVLSALGVELPPGAQGIDWMPRIHGNADAIDERMRVTQVGRLIAVRFDERWKIVFGTDHRDVASEQPHGPQLYDLVKDPDEERNLYDTPDGRRRYEALWTRYRDWRRDTRDTDLEYRGTRRPLADEEDHLEMLETLGYVERD